MSVGGGAEINLSVPAVLPYDLADICARYN
jgi:hypothetical protein